jgi:hypothetical protein
MLFVVVEFTESDGGRSVAVVPQNWLNNGSCYWPPYKKERLNRAVTKGEEPGADWQSCDCRILCRASNAFSFVLFPTTKLESK